MIKLADLNLDATILPPLAQELCEVIGITATLKLCTHLGGVKAGVPVEYRADHAITRVIGAEAMQKLVRVFGGERLDIPRCAKALQMVEAAQIAARLERGEKAPVLALEYHYTERWIWELKRRARRRATPDAVPQMSMFGSGK